MPRASASRWFQRSRASTLHRLLRARRLSRVALATLALGFAGSVCTAVWIAWPLPPDIMSPGPVASLVVQDRHGLVLRTTRAEDGSRGGWIPYGDIDPDILRAFLAVEDHRFFHHHGVDVSAVLRAAWTDVRAGRVVSGASTLTMQTARLLLPIPRGWHGKVLQALWALRLEAHLDKARIFELYLNRVPLGQGTRGVSAAARLYFDAPASNVSAAQAALLAALAHAPSRDNPLVAPARARKNRNAVLRRMAADGYLTLEEVTRAIQEPVLREGKPSRFLAPHFTTRAVEIAEREGVATGVLHTTLDLDLQRALEGEVRHAVDMLRDRGGNDAAVVVLDNYTGDVLAWVGSPDFWAKGAGQVDMVVSRRQPGSALKPFLYGTAFDHGFTAASVLPDVPHTYPTATGPYRPQNYDRRFHGPVRARQALASSFNVPAVGLTNRLGVDMLLSTLHAAGFASLNRSAEHYGLGLALGNGEVTLLELADAYRGLAEGGVWRPVRYFTDDAAGAGAPGRRFMSRGAAVLVLNILSDPVARMPGFGEETPFDFPFPAAAKTGTSRHFTDNWAVAATAGFTVAVWAGNADGRPMQGVSGVSGAGPLLYRSVLQTARRYPAGFLPTPEQAGAIPEAICRLSGMRATRTCPSMIEWFLPGTEPLQPDDWQVNGRTVLPAEYALWERSQGSDVGVRLAARGDRKKKQAGAVAPYTMISPRDGDQYSVPPGVEARYSTIPLTAVGATSTERQTWYVDGHRVHGTRWALEPGTHRFKVVWASGRTAEASITVG